MRMLLLLVGLGLAGCPSSDPARQDTDALPMDPDALPGDLGVLDADLIDARLADLGVLDAASRLDAAMDASLDAAPDAGERDAAPDAAAPPGCRGYARPVVAGQIEGDVLAEASGIAASRQSPGVLWMHNDSGNAPVLYAVSEAGVVRAQVPLPDATDLEDVAIARCPAAERWCIWVADIGDNLEARDAVRIFIVPEPPIADGEIIVDGITELRRTYPDGAHDAEALVVAEDGQRFWIITKVDGGVSQVFSSTPGAGPRGGLDEIARFDAPGVAVPMGRMITGADLHPSGQRLAIRVYTGSYEYWLGDEGVAALQTATPRLVSLGPLSEGQGEAIAYAADGDGLWTISEQPGGGQPLHRYACEP